MVAHGMNAPILRAVHVPNRPSAAGPRDRLQHAHQRGEADAATEQHDRTVIPFVQEELTGGGSHLQHRANAGMVVQPVGGKAGG